MPSPQKGVYAPSWLGKTPANPKVADFVGASSLPYKLPAVASAAHSGASAALRIKGPKAAATTNVGRPPSRSATSNKADNILRRGVNNKLAAPRTEDDRVQRLTTVRNEAAKAEHSKLEAWKTAHPELIHSPQAKRKSSRGPGSRRRTGSSSGSTSKRAAAEPVSSNVFGLVQNAGLLHGMAAKKVQRAFRAHQLARVHQMAAIKLQAFQRGHAERGAGGRVGAARALKRQQMGANKVQAHFRGHRERARGESKIKWELKRAKLEGATRFQAVYRGHVERLRGESVQRKELRGQFRREQAKAAATLQAIYRGHRGRKKTLGIRALFKALSELSLRASKIFVQWDTK